MKIPFFLVTGFLGSGKTTLLKRFIDGYAEDKKLAIVQNEFAPANIDGQELSSSDKSFKMLEVNKGSVFCVCLLGEFVKSLSDFIEAEKPDAVILESSGLSDPIAIVQMLDNNYLREKVYLSHIWSVVDSASFLKMSKLVTRLHHQVRVADTVILNKTDLAADNIESIKAEVKDLNPFAKMVETSYCDTNLSTVFLPFQRTPVAIERAPENAAFESCKKPDITVAVLKTTQKVSRSALEAFLQKYINITYRMKGFVLLENGKTVVVQSSYEQLEIAEVSNYRGNTELIAMGEDFTQKQFIDDFAG